MFVTAIALWLMAAPCLGDVFSDDSSECWVTTVGTEGVLFYKEADLSTGHERNFSFSVDLGKYGSNIDYNWNKKIVYVTTESDTIYTVQTSKNNHVASTEIKGARSGIAVDWENDVFFLEVCDGKRKLCAINMYNSQWEFMGNVTINRGMVHRISVDPYERFVFWLNLDRKKISRINYDSSEMTTVLKETNDFNYQDMTLDLASRRVFYVQKYKNMEGKSRLESTDYSGQDRIDYAINEFKYDYYYGLNVLDNCVYGLGYINRVEYIYKIHLDDPDSLENTVGHPPFGYHMTVIRHGLQDPKFLKRKSTGETTTPTTTTKTTKTARTTTSAATKTTTTEKTTTAATITSTTTTLLSTQTIPLLDQGVSDELSKTTTEIVTETPTTTKMESQSKDITTEETKTTTSTMATLPTTSAITVLDITSEFIPILHQEFALDALTVEIETEVRATTTIQSITKDITTTTTAATTTKATTTTMTSSTSLPTTLPTELDTVSENIFDLLQESSQGAAPESAAVIDTTATETVAIDTGPAVTGAEDAFRGLDMENTYVLGAIIVLLLLVIFLLCAYCVRRYYRKRAERSFIFTPPLTAEEKKARLV